MTITIYDVPGHTGRSFIPMCIRVRAVLNYKGIPHRTVWVEYPDIESTMREIGASPTRTKPDGSPFYTVPVISDPDHPTEDGKPTVVSDSWNISEYLDKTYPSSGVLFPSDTKGLQALLQEHVLKTVISVIFPTFLPKMYLNLQEGSKDYFRQTREARFNKKLEEVYAEGSDEWKEARKVVEIGLNNLAAVLDKNGKNSHYVIGNSITYADFIITSVLETVATFDSELWEEKIKHWDGGRWDVMRGKCLPYFKTI